MLSEIILEERGYKLSLSPLEEEREIFAGEWYKIIYDSTASHKYQISVTKYDQSRSSYWPLMIKNTSSEGGRDEIIISYSPFVQFILPNGDRFDVTYLISKNTTIDEIEEFFDRIYRSMGCLPN